jgi:hypothetical protein
MPSNQDFAPDWVDPKDLPARPAQTPQNKRPPTREGRGGRESRSAVNELRAIVIPQCTGTKSDGTPCHSPALRGKPLCYYHDPASRIRKRKTGNGIPEAPLPDFRDPMRMLDWAMRNLAAGRISTKAAGQLIYAVQQLIYR